MKKEVKYARMTCTSLKPTAPVFRLERKSKSLPTQEYAENLITYLDTARCTKTLTLQDLNHVLTGLTAQVLNKNSSNTTQDFTIGEHIAPFWIEDQYKWHLGVVETILDNGNPKVSYLYTTDNDRKTWTYPDPENKEMHETEKDQILLKNIKVNYLSSINIKCEISDVKAVEFLNQEINKLNI